MRRAFIQRQSNSQAHGPRTLPCCGRSEGGRADRPTQFFGKLPVTDVAELAGVSPTTVSRVINKKGYLSQKTIDKVHAAMQELNYKPNNLARGLQGKSAKLVGLIFPNISNIFYAELIEHLEVELFKQGY